MAVFRRLIKNMSTKLERDCFAEGLAMTVRNVAVGVCQNQNLQGLRNLQDEISASAISACFPSLRPLREKLPEL